MKIFKDFIKWMALAIGLVILWTLNFFLFCLVLGLTVALLFWLLSLNLDGFSFGTALIDIGFVVGSYFLFKNKKVQDLAKGLRDQLKNGL